MPFASRCQTLKWTTHFPTVENFRSSKKPNNPWSPSQQNTHRRSIQWTNTLERSETTISNLSKAESGGGRKSIICKTRLPIISDVLICPEHQMNIRSWHGTSSSNWMHRITLIHNKTATDIGSCCFFAATPSSKEHRNKTSKRFSFYIRPYKSCPAMIIEQHSDLGCGVFGFVGFICSGFQEGKTSDKIVRAVLVFD